MNYRSEIKALKIELKTEKRLVRFIEDRLEKQKDETIIDELMIIMTILLRGIEGHLATIKIYEDTIKRVAASRLVDELGEKEEAIEDEGIFNLDKPAREWINSIKGD